MIKFKKPKDIKKHHMLLDMPQEKRGLWKPRRSDGLMHRQTPACTHCGFPMKKSKKSIRRYKTTPILFAIIVALVLFIVMGPFSFIPAIIIGHYLTIKHKKVWRCVSCNAVIPRR